jgi:LmbE family N-acetylglucosaminyl deacetylase
MADEKRRCAADRVEDTAHPREGQEAALLTDRERLARQRARPLLVELYRALGRLGSTLTVMNTGAHPDDEQSGMLAALRLGYGMRVVIACSTRGEGGQNAIGPERGAALGVVRTRELEAAAGVLDADIAWLGHGPDDPVHDFGFSKNGTDTLARWGRERLLERVVRAYRRERPDIVIPTFLDVPGQHGHHRAMTEAAAAAIALAADPGAFPEQLAEGLTPWRVAKFYLPAWSGGGGTYDDELPPPNATVVVTAPGRDAATGAAYAEIGQWSRAAHATQGMGHWRAVPQTSWPLHLALGGTGPEADIRDGLPADLNALAATVNTAAGGELGEAQRAIDAARAAFPDRPAIVAALNRAAAALAAAEGSLDDAERAAAGHRIGRKRAEVDAALLLAAGVAATAWLEPAAIAPGGTAMLKVRVEGDTPVAVTPTAERPLTFAPAPDEPGLQVFTVAVPDDAAYTVPYPTNHAALGGNGELHVRRSPAIAGRLVAAALDLEEPLQVVPAHAVELDPPALILPLPAGAAALPVAVRVKGPAAGLDLGPAEGLAVTPGASGFDLHPQPALAPGRHRLPVLVDGRPGYRQRPIDYHHIGRTRLLAPAGLDVLALDLALPAGARVGYVGGGSDNVGAWLARMGLEPSLLGPEDLAGDLGGYSTLVVGIFAFGLRPDLAAITDKLHAWVRRGGHLVTLYHRPGDNWQPDRTPPLHLVIGSPSLRWRVTDPAAPVTVLLPRHPLLTAPNAIGPDDWAGWDKERGLYFAAEWDAAYEPLLAMSDAGEAPLTGALVSGAIGRGRHTHVSLVLHHQLDRLVPGAFRLLANLVQPAW